MLNRAFAKFLIIIFCLEIGLLTVFSSLGYIIKVMATEGVKVEDALGSDTLREIDAKASETFYDTFIKSGFYARIWHTFIPTEDERRAANDGLENMARHLFRWVDDRLTAVMTLIFQLLERLYLMGMWLPFSFIIIAGASYSGWTLRHIK